MTVDTSLKISGDIDIREYCNSNEVGQSRLIEQAHSEPAVFVQLYRCYYDAVFRYCAHRLFDRVTAEDVTSTVFLKAVENFHRFKGSEKQFRNWLYKIATNAVNDHLRKTARRKNALKLVGETIKTETADRKDADNDNAVKSALLKQAMLTLKPRYQTIITLRFFENLKLTEIAEVLGSSPGTVRSQLSRALVGLRKHIAFDKQGVYEDD